jgi:prevent-host-death family protein
MVMIMVNIHEVKAKLSEYVDAVARGEHVVICKRNQPVAELRAIEPKRSEPRPMGGGPHQFTVPDSFFAPMPDDFLDALTPPPIDANARPPTRRAAETKAPYGAPPRRKRP